MNAAYMACSTLAIPVARQSQHTSRKQPTQKYKKRHSENRRVYHVVRCQDSNREWYSCPTCGNVIAIESSTHKKNKKTSQWKKASLRSQDGGFTPQLDNTRQIFEDSKSWLWFSNASSVKRRTCATGLTSCVGLGGRYIGEADSCITHRRPSWHAFCLLLPYVIQFLLLQTHCKSCLYFLSNFHHTLFLLDSWWLLVWFKLRIDDYLIKQD